MNPCLLRLARNNNVRSDIIVLSLRLAITRKKETITLWVTGLHGSNGYVIMPSLLIGTVLKFDDIDLNGLAHLKMY